MTDTPQERTPDEIGWIKRRNGSYRDFDYLDPERYDEKHTTQGDGHGDKTGKHNAD